MKRIALFLCLMFAVTECVIGQSKHLIYVRYDVGHGSPSAIVNELDRMVNNSNDVLIYYSKGSHPIIATKDDWSSLRTRILTVSTSDAFDADVDFESLDSLFSATLVEKTNFGAERYTIRGVRDSEWDVTFILSKQMYNTTDAYELIPLQFVDISQLTERNIPFSFFYYDDSSSLVRVETLNHPLYHFSYSQSK